MIDGIMQDRNMIYGGFAFLVRLGLVYFKNFCKIWIVLLSLVCDKYYSIID